MVQRVGIRETNSSLCPRYTSKDHHQVLSGPHNLEMSVAWMEPADGLCGPGGQKGFESPNPSQAGAKFYIFPPAFPAAFLHLNAASNSLGAVYIHSIYSIMSHKFAMPSCALQDNRLFRRPQHCHIHHTVTGPNISSTRRPRAPQNVNAFVIYEMLWTAWIQDCEADVGTKANFRPLNSFEAVGQPRCHCTTS